MSLGVKARGEARGDHMDAATEVVLVPQIAQESFAREVVDIVRNLSKRVSKKNVGLGITNCSICTSVCGFKLVGCACANFRVNLSTSFSLNVFSSCH